MSVLVVGAGGHAKVVIATLRAAGRAVAGVLDDDPERRGASFLGVSVLGATERLAQHEGDAVLAIGSNAVRRRIADAFPDVRWTAAVHPSATVHSSVDIGAGAVVFAGAVVQPDSRIGRHAIVNTAATVDHDSAVGDFAHLAPGVHLAGAVTVGEGAFLGIGVVAVPGVAVGAWATVGAGGVVVRDLAPKVVAVGVPARPRRDLGSS